MGESGGVELLFEVYCMVNLVVFTPHEGTAFQETEEKQVGDCGGTLGTERATGWRGDKRGE